MGALGTAGRGDAAGDEPVDAAVSHEEAWDRPAGVRALGANRLAPGSPSAQADWHWAFDECRRQPNWPAASAV